MNTESSILTKRRRMRMLSFFTDAAVIAAILLLCEAIFGWPQLVASVKALKAMNGMGGTTEEFEAAYAAFNEMFNKAYYQSLGIWAAYEFAFPLLTGGRSAGRYVTGMRLVPVKNADKRWLTPFKYLLRAVVKPLLVLMFRGFPFMITVILIFADRTDRTGYDRMSGLAVDFVKNSPGKKDNI